MHLLGVREEDGWLESAWDFTYPVGWGHIQTAAYEVYDAFEKPEVLVRGEHVDIDDKEDIKDLEEELNLTIRGYCPLIKNRIMIIFHNQVCCIFYNMMVGYQVMLIKGDKPAACPNQFIL